MNKRMRTNRRSNLAGVLARASGRAISGAAGFTLIEMLVAVGAVAFVAVGIASIFASVGDTVSRGRSVSAITQYAAVLERQMREDFALLTRDGFMVMRHELADDGRAVPLNADQPNARPRRIDELMFFITVPSRSGREPLAPGFVPEGGSARIYYGMGQRQRPDSVGSLYALPSVQDQNLTGDLLGRNTPGNPNRFAESWTLLRHETTLVSIGGGLSDPPPSSITGAVANNRVQVALQPAADSIFRSINLLDTGSCTMVFPPAPSLWRAFDSRTSADQSPLFASGIVDVATTNLEEIRGIVTATPGLNAGSADPFNPVPPYEYVSPRVLRSNCAFYVGPNRVVGPVGVQQAWMLDAFPASSNPYEIDFGIVGAAGQEFPSAAYNFVNVPLTERARMRYEPAPPDMHSGLARMATDPTRGSYELANQYALASSAFIPRVTEFIVEWSFGKLDEQGQTIWHGAEREIDVDRNGSTTDPIDVRVLPYPQYSTSVRGTPDTRAGSFFVPYRLRTPAQAGATGVGNAPREFASVPRLAQPIAAALSGDFADVGDPYASYPVLPEVVHGVSPTGLGGSYRPTVSYFGYTLPFFDPEDPDGDPATPDAAANDTLEWPWPELVRVTVTLADPGDNTIERTFQYVFPTPGNTAR